MAHNRRVLDDAQRMRDKARRSDMLAATKVRAVDVLRSAACPDDGRTAARRSRSGVARPSAHEPSVSSSCRTRRHLARRRARAIARALSGSARSCAARRSRSAYRFEPGEDDDGITIGVGAARGPAAARSRGDGVDDPGLARRPKLRALLDALPKPVRKALGAARSSWRARAGRQRCARSTARLLPVLERAIHAAVGRVRILRDAWDLRTRARSTCRSTIASSITTTRCWRPAAISKSCSARSASARVKCGRLRRASATSAPACAAWDFDALAESVDDRRRRPPHARVSRARRPREHGRSALARVPGRGRSRDARRPAPAGAVRDSRTSLGKLEALLPAPLAQGRVRAPDSRSCCARSTKRSTDRRAAARQGARSSAASPRAAACCRRSLAELGRTAHAAHAPRSRKVRAALKPLAGKPGVARAVFEDVQSQLAHLAPAGSGGRARADRPGSTIAVALPQGDPGPAAAPDPRSAEGSAEGGAGRAAVAARTSRGAPSCARRAAPRASSTTSAGCSKSCASPMFAPELKTAVPGLAAAPGRRCGPASRGDAM